MSDAARRRGPGRSVSGPRPGPKSALRCASRRHPDQPWCVASNAVADPSGRVPRVAAGAWLGRNCGPRASPAATPSQPRCASRVRRDRCRPSRQHRSLEPGYGAGDFTPDDPHIYGAAARTHAEITPVVLRHRTPEELIKRRTHHGPGRCTKTQVKRRSGLEFERIDEELSSDLEPVPASRTSATAVVVSRGLASVLARRLENRAIVEKNVRIRAAAAASPLCKIFFCGYMVDLPS
jgi:hypothetical protein